MTLDPAGLAHLRHELRTPLNHVLGYSEMLLEDAGDAGELVTALQHVRGEGRAVLAVVEESLAATRVETAGLGLDRFAGALSGPLHRLGEAVERLGKLAAERGPAVSEDTERISGAVARLRGLVGTWTPKAGAVTAAAHAVSGSDQPERRAAAPAPAPGSTILVVDGC